MPVSSPLMAFVNSDVRSTAKTENARAASPTGDRTNFAGLLAEQLPTEIGSALHQLSPEQLAALEQAALAEDGKMLPPQLQEWLEHLPLEGEMTELNSDGSLGVIGQWMQWLQEPAGQMQASSAEDEALAGTTGMEGEQGGQSAKELASRQQPSKEQLFTHDLNRPSRQVASGQQDVSAVLQRASSDSQPLPSAMFGKLAEQLERSSASRGTGETERIDDMARPGSYNAAAAALTARPVVAPTQSMGVPFGQPSWGEAMVEKVMWMSSQNLRSVEIQLDPAELGPLEIHIQQRGQELQVQFVSQNPSVREALEAQMHRLRDMFGQQGMEQADVTVADRSAGDQSRQGDGQSAAERTAAQTQDRGTLNAADNGDMVAPSTPTAQWSPMQRLVDYYV